MKYFIVLISFLVLSCEPKCPNPQPPLFHKGEKVNMTASSFKKAVIINSRLNEETCEYEYTVTYFTLWETRRVKVVSEQELTK